MFRNYLKKLMILTILFVIVGLIYWLFQLDFSKANKIQYGLNFSQKYATELQLNWKQVLLAFLDELNVKKFRVALYWDLVEKESGVYNFADMDWQMNAIAKRGGKVILAIGNRVPRWPECHTPSWIYQFNDQEKQAKILAFLKSVVEHYKNSDVIEAWQVENEPYLKYFGECPPLDRNFFKQEVALVRSLDSRPIVITESGELSTWLKGGKESDWLGVSVYRITWNKIFGYFYYPLPPAHYYLKAKLIKLLTGNQNVFVSEMQAEPWLGQPILQSSFALQEKSMNPDKFAKNLAYIKRAGLSPVYLWGAEWWYWMKEKENDKIWLMAKDLFNKNK